MNQWMNEERTFDLIFIKTLWFYCHYIDGNNEAQGIQGVCSGAIVVLGFGAG